MKKSMLLFFCSIFMIGCLNVPEPEWIVFDQGGVIFHYPKGWKKSESATPAGISLIIESVPRPENVIKVAIGSSGKFVGFLDKLENHSVDKGAFVEKMDFHATKQGEFAGFSTFIRSYTKTKQIKDSEIKSGIPGKIMTFECGNRSIVIDFEGNPQKLRFNQQLEKWVEESFSCS